MSTQRIALAPTILMGLALAGCGGGEQAARPSAAIPLAMGPHGGPALALPGAEGFAEVISEATKPGTDPVVAVYFLKSDLRSPLTPPPADARIKTSAGEVPLSPSPGPARDPAGAGRMVSGPMPIDPDRISGELIAPLGSQPFSASFALGQ